MNWDRVEGNWKQWKGKAKEQWGKLNDDVLTQVGGNRDQLVGKIQETYGMAKDEAEHQVDEWSSSLLDGGQGGTSPSVLSQRARAGAADHPMSEDWERGARETAASVGRWAGEARAKAEQNAEVLKARIQEQPFGALALAAGIGFVLGVLFSRK